MTLRPQTSWPMPSCSAPGLSGFWTDERSDHLRDLEFFEPAAGRVVRTGAAVLPEAAACGFQGWNKSSVHDPLEVVRDSDDCCNGSDKAEQYDGRDRG